MIGWIITAFLIGFIIGAVLLAAANKGANDEELMKAEHKGYADGIITMQNRLEDQITEIRVMLLKIQEGE